MTLNLKHRQPTTRGREGGRAAVFSKLDLLEPSAPPQVIMTLESKCEIRIHSEIIEPAG